MGGVSGGPGCCNFSCRSILSVTSESKGHNIQEGALHSLEGKGRAGEIECTSTLAPFSSLDQQHAHIVQAS